MPSTRVEIANSALVKIGTRRIVNFDEESKEGELVRLRYDECRKIVSSMHPWGCLKKRAVLAPDVAEPAYGYGKAFTLPADCLRVLPYDSLYNMQYQIEGRKLLCDQNVLYLTYVKNEEDVSQFDSLFAEALALYLAADLSYSLSESDTLTTRLLEQFQRLLSSAKTASAQQLAAQIISADEWLESRFGGVNSSPSHHAQHPDG